MKKIFLSTLSMLLPFLLAAQMTISGRVSNSQTKEPLAGAQVVLLPMKKTMISDPNGDFVFKNLEKGKYRLTVSFIGFATESKDILLEKNSSFEIALNPTSYQLENVIVSGIRANEKTPVSYERIVAGNDKLDRNNEKDLSYILSGTPSAVATSDAGTGVGYSYLRIRGTDQSRINVTINGIPFNDAESHQVYWVNIPDIASSLSEIQVQRGVGSSTNGTAAFGASINMQTIKLQQKSYAEYAASAGSFNTFKNTVNFGTGLIGDHFTVDGRLSAISSDGYIDRASADLKSYYASATYFGKNTLARFNVFSGTEKTYMAWDGVPSAILPADRTFNGQGMYTDIYGNTQFYDNQTDNYKQTHYQLLLMQNLTPNWTANLGLHYTQGFGYYEQYKEDRKLADYGMPSIQLPNDFYLLGRDTVWVKDSLIKATDLIQRKYLDNDFYGITFSTQYVFPKLDLTLGGSYNTYDGNHFGEVIWTQFAFNTQPNYEWYRGKGVKKDFALYAKAIYELYEELYLYGDLQYRNIDYSIEGIDDDLRDITQQHYYNFFNPKAGLMWSLNPKNSFYASVAVAHREPARDNFVDANPEKPSPKPERLIDFELGYRFSAAEIGVTSNIYFMKYKDQLALTGAINDVGAAIMENVPESYRAGLEVAMQCKPFDQLDWKLGFTLSQSKIKKFTEYVDNWDTWGQEEFEHRNTDLAFSPSVIAANEFIYSFGLGLKLALSTKFVGKQYIDNTQNDDRSLKPYSTTDFRVLYALKIKAIKNFEILASVNNIFNKKYESNAWVYRYYENDEAKVQDGYFPQAGTNFTVGVNVKF